MSVEKPTYDDLERRCRRAESLLEKIRSGDTATSPEESGEFAAKLEKAEDREAHIKNILLAIRNVNQLIVKETDRQRLVESACENLTETLGYYTAWIALLDWPDGNLRYWASSGSISGLDRIHELLKRRELTGCMRTALDCEETHVVINPAGDCLGCPSSNIYADCAALCRRLACDGTVYGVLTVSVPAEYAHDPEERSLFDELAGDLSFALSRLDNQEALAESQRRYSEIFNRNRDGYVMVNAGGGIIDANPAFCEMLGYSLDELKSLKNFYQITPQRWREWEKEEIWNKRLLGSGYSGIYEKEYVRKDGTVFPVELQSYAVFDDEGQPEYLLGVARDVSDLRRSEQALHEAIIRQQTAVHAGGVGLWDWDLKTNRVTYSSEWKRQIGYEDDEIGDSYEEWESRVHPDDLEPILEEIHSYIAEDRPSYEVEFRFRHKDGSYRWILAQASVLKDESGNPVRTLGSHVDITELRQAIEALNASLKEQEAVFESSLVGIMVLRNRTITKVNRRMAEMLGYSPDEIEGRSPEQLHLSYENFVEFGDEYYWRLAEKEIVKVEYPLKHKDGRTVWCLFSGKAIAPPDLGRGAVWVIDDITERKKMEEKLCESEHRFRSFVENAGEIVYALSPDGTFTYISPNWLQFMGEPPEAAIGGPFEPYVHPEDSQVCRDFLAKVLRTGERQESVEYRVRHADGTWRWHVSTGSPLRDESGNVASYVAIARDVTAQRQAEKALRESEARFTDILEKLESIPVQGYDSDRRVIYWNSASSSVYGYTRKEALGQRLEDLIVPESIREQVIRDVNSWLSGGPAIPAGELILRDKYGIAVPVYSSHVLHVTESGEKELFCFDVDLRSLRQKEDELRRLATAIDQAGEVVVITDTDGKIQYVNPAFERTTGYSREEALGQNPRILKSGEQKDEVYAELWKTISSGSVWEGRLVNRRKDGSLYSEDATISPVRDESGEIMAYVAVKRDITRELELERQYHQSQKMEAIGQLTGGVAHDFNNLLHVIIGSTEMAKGDLEPGHKALELLSEVSEAGERAANLVKQLLLFSRRQIMQPSVLSLNTAIEDLLRMLRRIIGEHIQLRWQPGKTAGRIHADRGMIEQAVLNLCINARDAMPEGGTLTIETEDIEIDDEYCKEHAWASRGRYVLLRIYDTGTGIDEETLNHIFEPFFTTKDIGKGTGLGLATVYGIVKQHCGMITVESEVGKGSVFRLYFPVSKIAKPVSDERPTNGIEGGTETILLAEDDDMVRKVARNILERSGYAVITANDGLRAVEKFREHKESIDMIILDVVMPEMSGREVFDHLQEMQPDLPALFTSGYSENAIHTDFILNEGLRFLQKPYAPNALLEAVRSTLDQRVSNIG